MPRETPDRQRAVHGPQYRRMLGRLRQARIEAGLTQVQVAAALGRTQAFVSKCELGERRIDPIDLVGFARIYHRPMDYFVQDGRKRGRHF